MSTASKAVLNIHSSSRTYGTTSNFMVNLGGNVPKPKSISVLSCELPNTFYNLFDFNSQLSLQLVSNSNQELLKMTDTQNMLRFRVYDGRSGTYAPTFSLGNTFTEWVSIFNSADRDFRFAYTTAGAQLVKKTPLASISINYNALTTYEAQPTTISNLTTLIKQQLSGNVGVTQEMINSFKFEFDTASRRYKIYFEFVGLVVEVDTTGTLNPVFGINNTESYGVYLPVNSVAVPFYYTVKVESKNYDGAALATELQTKLVAAAIGDSGFLSTTPFTVTYNSTTHKITITAYKLSGGLTVVSNDARISVDFKNSPLDDIIGIKDIQAPANPLVSAGILNLGGTNTVYITSDKASGFTINSVGMTSFTLQKIQMSEPFGSTVFYKSYHPDLERFNLDGLSGADMSSISLSLRDFQGNLLSNNNTEWSISLLLWF